jgi:hypothetical protein
VILPPYQSKHDEFAYIFVNQLNSLLVRDIGMEQQSILLCSWCGLEQCDLSMNTPATSATWMNRTKHNFKYGRISNAKGLIFPINLTIVGFKYPIPSQL